MKILVANSKGGVGKSTTSVQIIAPFLYTLSGKKTVALVEVDKANKDSDTFINSSILNAKQLSQFSPDIGADLTDEIINNDNLIVDIAGGEASLDVLDILTDNGMIINFNIIVIPLMDGEQDAVNAIRTYNHLRSTNQDIKTVFALSKVDNTMSLEMQFFDFFGDSKNRINGAKGLIEKIKEEDRNLIEIHSSDTIKYSRIFGNTVYEIAQKDTRELQKELTESIENKEDDLTRKISYKMGILNKSIRYLEDTIQRTFKVLEG